MEQNSLTTVEPLKLKLRSLTDLMQQCSNYIDKVKGFQIPPCEESERRFLGCGSADEQIYLIQREFNSLKKNYDMLTEDMRSQLCTQSDIDRLSQGLADIKYSGSTIISDSIIVEKVNSELININIGQKNKMPSIETILPLDEKGRREVCKRAGLVKLTGLPLDELVNSDKLYLKIIAYPHNSTAKVAACFWRDENKSSIKRKVMISSDEQPKINRIIESVTGSFGDHISRVIHNGIDIRPEIVTGTENYGYDSLTMRLDLSDLDLAYLMFRANIPELFGVNYVAEFKKACTLKAAVTVKRRFDNDIKMSVPYVEDIRVLASKQGSSETFEMPFKNTEKDMIVNDMVNKGLINPFVDKVDLSKQTGSRGKAKRSSPPDHGV